ncbi:hypothetical protein D3C86_1863960 [compost metagenome]
MIDNARDDLAVQGEGDGDAVVREAMGVVGGAVDRVDDPAIARRRGLQAFLLAQDVMVGVALGDLLADEGFAHPIDLGHEIDVPLVLDALDLALVLAQDGAGLAGDLLGEVTEFLHGSASLTESHAAHARRGLRAP